MAFKQFMLNEQTPITIYKRKASRSIRITVSAKGEVKVSMPLWTPYSAGLAFAKAKSAWITEQLPIIELLRDGQAIGKYHRLEFRPSDKALRASGRVTGSLIVVSYPGLLRPSDSSVQQAADKACLRALRNEAEGVLASRLRAMAAQYDFNFKSVTMKQLKGRWGSCNQAKEIVLNIFLMQLPWELIDYVLIHELSHTEHLNHSSDFWERVLACDPAYKVHRQRLRKHKPVVIAADRL